MPNIGAATMTLAPPALRRPGGRLHRPHHLTGQFMLPLRRPALDRASSALPPPFRDMGLLLAAMALFG